MPLSGSFRGKIRLFGVPIVHLVVPLGRIPALELLSDITSLKLIPSTLNAPLLTIGTLIADLYNDTMTIINSCIWLEEIMTLYQLVSWQHSAKPLD